MGASRSDIDTRQPLFEAYRCVRTIIDAARHGDRPSAVIHRENVCSFRQRSAANQRRHRSDFVTKWPFCLIWSLARFRPALTRVLIIERADPEKLRKARAGLAKGIGINKVAKAVGLGVGTVAKLKDEMLKAEMAAAA